MEGKGGEEKGREGRGVSYIDLIYKDYIFKILSIQKKYVKSILSRHWLLMKYELLYTVMF